MQQDRHPDGEGSKQIEREEETHSNVNPAMDCPTRRGRFRGSDGSHRGSQDGESGLRSLVFVSTTSASTVMVGIGELWAGSRGTPMRSPTWENR